MSSYNIILVNAHLRLICIVFAHLYHQKCKTLNEQVKMPCVKAKLKENPKKQSSVTSHARAECPLNSNFSPLGSFTFSFFSFLSFVRELVLRRRRPVEP